MSMLNFKYGKYSGLFNEDGSKKLGLSEGTVYITTDEKAMYVDLNTGANGVERIRLSQIINLEDITAWQNLKPPYSTEAFYYIVKANALLKYTGTSWQQINTTEQISEDLTKLTQRVTAAEKTIGEHGTAITNHLADTSNPHNVTAEQVGLGKVDNLSADELQARFTGSVAQNNKKFALGGDVWTAVEGAKTLITNHTNDAENPHGVTAEQVGLGNVDNKSAATLKLEFTGAVAQGDDGFTKGADVYTAIDNAKTAVVGNANTDTASSQTVAGAHKAAAAVATNLQQHTSADNPHGITADKLGVGAFKDYTRDSLKEEYTGEVKSGDDGFVEGGDVYTAIDNAKKALVGTSGDSASTRTIEGALKAASVVAGNLQDHLEDTNNPHKVTAAQLGVGDFKDYTRASLRSEYTGSVSSTETAKFTTGKAVYDAVKDAKDTITGGNTTTIASLVSTTGNHGTRITNLETDLENLEDNMVARIQAADAMVYKGTIAASTALPTSQVFIGYTLKATQEFTLNGNTIHIGDLLVANAAANKKEGADGYLAAADIVWDHIPSGYVADYNPDLTVAHTANSNVVDINLVSAHDSVLGDFQISADKTTSPIRVAVEDGTNIVLSMAWTSWDS